jgi:membrane protein required for colicin V production
MAKWIDIIIMIVVGLALFKGFRRGLIREVFSIVGAILAVALAYHFYQELSQHLVQVYPLEPLHAQAIAFIAILVGISLLAALSGWVWSKAIRLTPFAVLDHLGGAAFGVFKVGVVLIVAVAILSNLNVPPVDAILDESAVVQEVRVLIPFVQERLEVYWPQDWAKPDWLFVGRAG